MHLDKYIENLKVNLVSCIILKGVKVIKLCNYFVLLHDL